MTVKEFAEKHKTKEVTVKKWIEKGFIAGVVKQDNEYMIPSSARKPYTERRAKNGKAILKSIVRACEKRCGISAALYKITEQEFQNYITSLLEDGIISAYEEDGIIYYNVTLKGTKYIHLSFQPSDFITAAGVIVSAVS